VDLIELDHLPAGLLEKPASALYQQLTGPTLIQLPGRPRKPLFISVLQHGNEDSGWEAIRRLLKSHYQFDDLPRPLIIFIGNVLAARHRLRRLEDQPDFNRCWPGGEDVDSEYSGLFQRVQDLVIERQPIACIDIHNNSGLNPHYGAINRIRSDYLRLAAMFSPKVVYFTMPKGTLSQSFSEFFPSVTLECGQAGEVHGTDHSLGYLETCLHLDEISTSRVDADEVHLYHMVATVKVREDILFGFGGVPADLLFRSQLDEFNFCELPAGTSLGETRPGIASPLIATNMSGEDVTDHYFSFEREEIKTLREIMPSMLTHDRRVIRQDCLCYLMERIHFEDHVEVAGPDVLPEAIDRTDRPGSG
jgi:succinylglutamate desuccinylase